MDEIDKIIENKLQTQLEKLGGESVETTPKKWRALREEIQKEIDETTIEVGKEYENIINVISIYCDIDEKYLPILALWIIGTYVHKEFNSYPYLYFNAMRGSGKSRILSLIAALSYKGKKVMNLTESTLFRASTDCTLCIDEFESVGSKEKAILRELLNASYKKGTIVERMKKVNTRDGESYKVEQFDLYNPIVMANIWGIDEVLGDRCINVVLEKSTNPAITKLIEDFDTSELVLSIKGNLEKIKCRLCRVVTVNNIQGSWNDYIRHLYTNNIHNTYNTNNTQTSTTPNKPLYSKILSEEILFKINKTGIDSRSLELFFPLFVLANCLDWVLFDNMLKIAKELSEQRKTEEFAESRDVMIIDFISQADPKYLIEFVSMIDLTRKFKTFAGELTEEDSWINSKWIGRALKRLNLITSKRRVSKGREITLNINKAKEKLNMFKIK